MSFWLKVVLETQWSLYKYSVIWFISSPIVAGRRKGVCFTKRWCSKSISLLCTCVQNEIDCKFCNVYCQFRPSSDIHKGQIALENFGIGKR